MNRLNRLLLAVGVLLVAAAAVQASVTVNMTYTWATMWRPRFYKDGLAPQAVSPCGLTNWQSPKARL